MRIDFDPETHTYRVDGALRPSVTEVLGVLQDFGHVNADLLKRAQEFGKAVHKMVELHEAGTLDTEALDPALQPYLAAYLTWRNHFQPEAVQCEVCVASAKYRYAGTLDLAAIKAGRTCLLDVKSGQSKTVGPQTYGYKLAYEEMTGLRIHERRCLRLTDKGPKVIPLDDPADQSAFLSCLNVYNWRATHGTARTAA